MNMPDSGHASRQNQMNYGDRIRYESALMEKDQHPPISNDKSSDKKAPPQGGNLVWYMLGLGVLLLLMVTMFTTAPKSRSTGATSKS